MITPFVHLNLRTEFSIIDSIVQIDPLMEEIKKHSPAVAIADIANLFGMVKFYKAAIQQGIKPIIGTQLWVQNEIDNDNNNKTPNFHKIILLCQNQIGYQNLTKLISRAYHEGLRLSVPLVKKQWIIEAQEGLIALSGAQAGAVGKSLLQDSLPKASLTLQEWMSIFPNRFYIELQRNNRMGERIYEKNALILAKSLHCPVVATNEVVFLNKSDFEAHRTRVCIQEGVTLESMSSSLYSEEQYLKTADEMRELFRDIPSAIENTIEIAKRCNLILKLDEPVLPSFPVPHDFTEETFLQKASLEGLAKRLTAKFAKENTPESERAQIDTHYHERLNQELLVINSMGFPGYFLIVADFIHWAKRNKIPVGPGRGSGAGSLVAYSLEITDLDPLTYDLLFERFLNPERISMPDFDIDFCMDNRDKVIDYVVQRYGRHNVSQIATFGTMAAKAVIRDVGRALGHPYGFVDKIAKLIPFEIGITLEKALTQEVALQERYQTEEEVRNLLDLAKKLEGITRNVGKHAGGVVIAPSDLTDYAPLYYDQESHQGVIQFDKDDVEAIGLTKFDFLGLKTLTIIDWAVQNSNRLLALQNLPPIDIQNIPLDCQQTFSLLKSCATTAIFQLESRGMKELIKRLQPDEFEEIIALVALFRPGPLQSGMVDDFINRKHGRAQVEYLHPAIEAILKPTYGVILYQEQVMQIAQTLAGYTLGGADLLRRAMGKKKPEEMASQRAIFIKGAVDREVEERTASYIFDLMEKFAGYGFNKSHSAAYALVSYQTAWLKTHHPSAFMAAVLSADMDNTDKIVNFIEECHSLKIKVIPPDIHTSNYYFTVNENNEIVYGLGAIKVAGEAAIAHLIEQRQKRPFKHLFDLCERTDSRKVNKRVLESLIKSGTFDAFGQERSHLMSTLDEAMKQAEQLSKNLQLGQHDLFQGIEDPIDSNNPNQIYPLLKHIKAWTTPERLQGEKESLGMYFSGHPLEIVDCELKKMGVETIDPNATPPQKERKVLIAGILVSHKSLQTRNGDRMCVMVLDDRFKRMEITLFPESYQKYRELLIKDQLLVIESTLSADTFKGGIRIVAQALHTLANAREKFVKKLHIKVQQEKLTDNFVDKLKECLMHHARGPCPVYIEFQQQQANTMIKLGRQWDTQPTSGLITMLSEMLPESQVQFEYS
ncbi:MAG: DNA polymerase III subunit alpha [Candidatus Berkiellales bacterium]